MCEPRLIGSILLWTLILTLPAQAQTAPAINPANDPQAVAVALAPHVIAWDDEVQEYARTVAAKFDAARELLQQTYQTEDYIRCNKGGLFHSKKKRARYCAAVVRNQLWWVDYQIAQPDRMLEKLSERTEAMREIVNSMPQSEDPRVRPFFLELIAAEYAGYTAGLSMAFPFEELGYQLNLQNALGSCTLKSAAWDQLNCTLKALDRFLVYIRGLRIEAWTERAQTSAEIRARWLQRLQTIALELGA